MKSRQDRDWYVYFRQNASRVKGEENIPEKEVILYYQTGSRPGTKFCSSGEENGEWMEPSKRRMGRE